MNHVAVNEAPAAILPLEMRDPPVIVSAVARPFSTEPQIITIREGATLAEILTQAVPDPFLHPYAVVMLEGEEIRPGCYRLVRPKAGKSVAIRVVPKNSGGGGKKNILATIAMIAVVIIAAVATFYVGGAGGWIVGAGQAATAGSMAAGAAVGAAIPLAGPLHVSAALPEPGR